MIESLVTSSSFIFRGKITSKFLKSVCIRDMSYKDMEGVNIKGEEQNLKLHLMA